jgi:hypothetical protein
MKFPASCFWIRLSALVAGMVIAFAIAMGMADSSLEMSRIVRSAQP